MRVSAADQGCITRFSLQRKDCTVRMPSRWKPATFAAGAWCCDMSVMATESLALAPLLPTPLSSSLLKCCLMKSGSVEGRRADRSLAHSSLISSTIRTLFAGWPDVGMLAQNSAALMFECMFQVRWVGCMSESNTTCVLRVEGGSSAVGVSPSGDIVSGVVGVFEMEFWPSLCREPSLCSLPDYIVDDMSTVCIRYSLKVLCCSDAM